MRMLGVSIAPGDYDLGLIRAHIVQAFENAWAMGKLSEAPLRPLNKRELCQPADAQNTKRQKH